jgi:hypothetical protein
MDRLSSWMVRSALIWLVAGVLLGVLMVLDPRIPGQFRLWFQPSHTHMLFVGWFVQFALGIAYWLMPRKRSPGRPLGYHEQSAIAAMIALNTGLALRVIFEPLERAGHASDATFALLGLAAVLQASAIALFAGQLWTRVGPRMRAKPRSE